LYGEPIGSHEFIVNCDTSEKLQDAIDQARSRDTILVSGVCNEQINFGAGKDNITIDGQGGAVINGGPDSIHTIGVKARDVRILGFTILGGMDVGIRIRGDASARVDGNYITGAAYEGITVRRGSIATIVNNTIIGNGGSGITVFANSQARIGFNGQGAGPNTIESNGADGVNISQSSHAWVVESVIRNNQGSGVVVSSVSHAHISSNAIDGNFDGVRVVENSGVFLGNLVDGGIFGTQNETTVNNTKYGVRCRINSYASGGIGMLNGDNGTKNFDDSCVDNLF